MTTYEISDPASLRIDNNFKYHEPHGDQSSRFVLIRDEAGRFARLLSKYVPESRELALAMTNLEQAVFWANAGIARNE
jgi:hypothetical protein